MDRNIFISFSHKDKSYRDELVPALPPLSPSRPFPAKPRSPRATISAIAGASWPIILKSRPSTGGGSSAATRPVVFGSGWKTAGGWANCRKG